VLLIAGFVFALYCRVRRSRTKTHTGIAIADEYDDEEDGGVDLEDPEESESLDRIALPTGYGMERQMRPSGYGIVHTGYGCVSPGGTYNDEMNMLEERTSII